MNKTRLALLLPFMLLPAAGGLDVFAKAAPPPPPPPDAGAPSKAVTPEIIEAIRGEMTRDMTELPQHLRGAPPLYSVSYKITEVDVNDVSASLGETTSRRNRHFVNLEARVRVGSTDFDNGNFAVAQAEEIDGTAAATIPLEATPKSAAHAAWLVTDQAYKEALIQIRAKFEARQTNGQGNDVPSWTAEKPVVSTDPILVPPLESLDELESRVKQLSTVFRDQSALRESHVAITSYLERRWYLSSDGTNVTDTRRASGVVIEAAGQADDGQLVHDYLLRYGHTAKDLPSDDDLRGEAKKLVDSVGALEKAPRMTRYRGPVLFEGEGAVGLVRYSLAPNLGGTPVPEGLNPQDAKQFGGALTEDVGTPALAPMLSIIDDPTLKDAAGKALIGGYKIDDEGTPAQRVEVVKNGTLKTLLTSRTPSAKGQTSNGHARRTAEGGAFLGTATNLLITGSSAQSRKGLEQRLVQAAQARGLKYGLVIRKLDDAAITGAPDFTRRELVAMIKSTDLQLVPPAIEVYRIYPNGKEELVRGAQLAEVPITAWEDVMGVSNTTTVYNFLASDQNQLTLRLSGGTEDGNVPSGGIESAIVTPDILVKRLDVTAGSISEHAQPIVSQPK
nr:metallopeptidase TldD-related protein [Kofleriaceae bacterium]